MSDAEHDARQPYVERALVVGRRAETGAGSAVMVGQSNGRAAIAFERNGHRTVQFMLTPEGRQALEALLRDSGAGEPWEETAVIREGIQLEWRVVEAVPLSSTAKRQDERSNTDEQ